uniref:Retinol binding protein 1a, cellular n=1 Tax=Cyprinus carpio TaxID=7962 RepID=A0A8C2CV31_CYPCA
MSKPNYTGIYNMVSQENFEEYLAALDVNYALRKVVCILKPSKHIEHDVNSGKMTIKTVTTFRFSWLTHFQTKELNWDGDKLVCVQRGEKEGRGWTHWLEGNLLHLVRKQGLSRARKTALHIYIIQYPEEYIK